MQTITKKKLLKSDHTTANILVDENGQMVCIRGNGRQKISCQERVMNNITTYREIRKIWAPIDEDTKVLLEGQKAEAYEHLDKLLNSILIGGKVFKAICKTKAVSRKLIQKDLLKGTRNGKPIIEFVPYYA